VRGLKESISNLSCENILECFYGLNESDIQTYKLLISRGELRIEEISRESGKSENTVYKSLQKLMIAGIVLRDKKVIRGGGYYYTYKALSPPEVADDMERILREWCVKVRNTIEEFRSKYGEVVRR